MALGDSGGFDLVLELAPEAVARQLRPAIEAANGDVDFPVANWGTLTFTTQLTLAPIRVAADATVTATLSSAGTELSWPELRSLGTRVIAAGSAPFAFDVTLAARPVASGTSLALDCPPGASSVHIGAGTLESIPGVQAWLALVDLVSGHAAREAERARLYAAAEAGLSGALDAALPDRLPLGTLPSPPVGAVEIVGSGDELRVLMTIGGTRGNPAAITRSAIRRAPGGTPLDIAGVVVGNGCLLRDLLRPVLTAGLGLPAGGFLPSATHPCAWGGTVDLPASIAGITPRLRSVRAGTDAAGMIHVLLGVDGQHPTGAYGFTGTLDLSFGASITGTGAGRSLTLTLGTSVVTSFDLSIAPWVYVLAITTGSPTLVTALAITDVAVGGAIGGAVNAGIGAALGSGSLALPLPATGIGPTTLSLAQADAARRTVSLAGLTISEFPMNDAIATIG